MYRSGRKTRVTASRRSGLIFSVARLHRAFKSLPNIPNRVSKGASIYFTAVVEYLTGMHIDRIKREMKTKVMGILIFS